MFGSGETSPEVLRGIITLLLQLRGCVCGGGLPLGSAELYQLYCYPHPSCLSRYSFFFSRPRTREFQSLFLKYLSLSEEGMGCDQELGIGTL